VTAIGLAVLLLSNWLRASSVTLLSASLGLFAIDELASSVAEAEKGSNALLGKAHSLFKRQMGLTPSID
jgi:hypothetical protein